MPSFDREQATRPGTLLVLAPPGSALRARVEEAAGIAGLEVLEPRDAGRRTWAGVQAAEVVVAVVEEALSSDALYWAGVASVLGKKLLVVTDSASLPTDLTGVPTVRVDARDGSSEDIAGAMARLRDLPAVERAVLPIPADDGTGEEVDAEVVDVKPAVAVVRTDDGRQGILLPDDLSWTRKVQDLRRALRPGQRLRGVLVGQGEDRGRFSVRALEDDPWPAVERLVGSGPVEGAVHSWNPRFGLFVTLGDTDVNGLVPRSKLPDEARFEVGEPVDVEVRRVDRHAREVELFLLARKTTPAEAPLDHRPGERVVGTVTQVDASRGYALVELPDGFTAILPMARLSLAGRDVLAAGMLRVGNRVPVVVAEVDHRRRRIELTDDLEAQRWSGGAKVQTLASRHAGLMAQRFGRRVRAFRQWADLSQEALAVRAHLHRTYVGSLERGERNPTLWNILKLAEALGVDPAELLRGMTASGAQQLGDEEGEVE